MGYHVAVVEDDPDTLENYIDVLSDEGYEVSTYTNTEDAITGLGQKKPDLTILDEVIGSLQFGDYGNQALTRDSFQAFLWTVFISAREYCILEERSKEDY